MDGLVQQQHISLAHALDLLDRTRSEAEKQSLQLALCVVDGAGHVVASERMDGAALGAMRLAVGRAYAAVLWGMPTGAFTASTQPGGDDWGFNGTDERIVVYAGGVPLYAGD